MRNYYIYIGILGIVVATIVITGFNLVGLPQSQRDINLDTQRVQNFSDIKYQIDTYYQTNHHVPVALVDLPSYKQRQTTTFADPVTKKQYTYEVTSNTKYKLCTEFAAESTTEQYDLNSSYSQSHKKGYDCLSYMVSDYLINQSVTLASTATPTPPIVKILNNPSFEEWGNLPTYWTLTQGTITKSNEAHSGVNAVEFAAKNAQILLQSSPIRIDTNLNYDVSLWYKTFSDCPDCGFIGFKFYTPTSQEITEGVTNCGTYNPYTKMWYNFIQGKSDVYKKVELTCTMPSSTYQYSVIIGLWNQSDFPWNVDDISVTPQKSLYQSMMIGSAKPCPYPLKDGMCELPNCSYSYPNDIYKKGKIVVGDAFKKYGRPSGTFNDECTNNNTQVKEATCVATVEGNYGESAGAAYNCPKGCLDGVCIE